jgi:hypothetical protein
MAKKIKPDQSYVLTSNDLRSGDVLFWSTVGEWIHSINGSKVFSGEKAADFEELGATAELENTVVGTYITPVRVEGNQVFAIELREQRRVAGPSISYGSATTPSHIPTDLAA